MNLQPLISLMALIVLAALSASCRDRPHAAFSTTRTMAREIRIVMELHPEELKPLCTNQVRPVESSMLARWFDSASISDAAAKDASGNRFYYRCYGEDFEVVSSGQDGRMGTKDDIVER